MALIGLVFVAAAERRSAVPSANCPLWHHTYVGETGQFAGLWLSQLNWDSGNLDVGAREVLTHEQKWFSQVLRKRVGECVAQIERCFVASPAAAEWGGMDQVHPVPLRAITTRRLPSR